ncbi:MAG TPA: BON domain-containing protein [Terracidiphilus sp.]|nr:BON domain-containing protein [Terracidiphilus sp.]
MNRPLFKRVVPQTLAWVSVILLGGIIALAQDATPAGQRTDGQIEMDVVHALDASQALKNDLITAATIQGEVTLSGTVSSDSSKQLAESIVKGVPGVTGVKDNLKVGNPADDPNAQGLYNQDNGAQQDEQSAGNPPQQPQMAPSPDQGPAYGQDNNQAPPPPAYGGQQAPPPAYGQQAPPPPGYGQSAPPPPGYGQAPPPPGYGQQPYRPQYGQAQRPAPFRFAQAPVTVPAGTLIQVRTSEPVNSKRAKGGEPIQFTVIQDVTFGGVLAIPRGATVHGVIAEVNHPDSGSVKGSTELGLQLTSLDLEGQTYPLQSDLFRVKGPGKGGRTAESAFGGALLGALIGGAAGGGSGAAIGAVAGGGVGTAASAAAPAPGVWIPTEALVSFHLAAPVTVSPVSREEAARLAQGLYPGGPNLYRRGGYYGGPYGYYTGYYPYPYGYPPVYYRPYYAVGGVYYWR